MVLGFATIIYALYRSPHRWSSCTLNRRRLCLLDYYRMANPFRKERELSVGVGAGSKRKSNRKKNKIMSLYQPIAFTDGCWNTKEKLVPLLCPVVDCIADIIKIYSRNVLKLLTNELGSWSDTAETKEIMWNSTCVMYRNKSNPTHLMLFIKWSRGGPSIQHTFFILLLLAN